MKSTLFREKSMERISSPEKMNEYIRVSSPSVWILLSAIIILLAGVCVWGVFGKMDTKITLPVLSEGEKTVAYVKHEDADRICAGMTAIVSGKEGEVVSVSEVPVQVDASFNTYLKHIGSMTDGEWVYEVLLNCDCQQGVHEAVIVVESISPISFALN